MNGAGQQLFACACFAMNQNGAVMLRHTRGHFKHTQQGLRVADDVFKTVVAVESRAEIAHFINQVLTLKGTMHGSQQRIVVNRLGDVVVGAEAHGLHGGFNRAKGCNQNDGRLYLVFVDATQQLNAVKIWHLQICNNKLRARLGEQLQSFASRGGLSHLIACFRQLHLQNAAHAAVIIDHQNGFIGHEAAPLLQEVRYGRWCRQQKPCGMKACRHVA